jgi:ribonuclease-3
MVMTVKAIDSDYYREKSAKLLDKLKIKYNDISLYVLCFIHRSIVNERPDFAPLHNERLEFLGDAVLELVVTDKLYNDFPKKTEGDLTDIRSAIVRGKNLALVARKLDFKEYLFL